MEIDQPKYREDLEGELPRPPASGGHVYLRAGCHPRKHLDATIVREEGKPLDRLLLDCEECAERIVSVYVNPRGVVPAADAGSEPLVYLDVCASFEDGRVLVFQHARTNGEHELVGRWEIASKAARLLHCASEFQPWADLEAVLERALTGHALAGAGFAVMLRAGRSSVREAYTRWEAHCALCPGCNTLRNRVTRSPSAPWRELIALAVLT